MFELFANGAARPKWFGRSRTGTQDPNSPDFVPTRRDYDELLARIDSNLDQIEQNLAACVVTRC